MLNSKCGQNGGHCRSWLGVESYKKSMIFGKNNDQTMMRM
jgi:hypothetical protein